MAAGEPGIKGMLRRGLSEPPTPAAALQEIVLRYESLSDRELKNAILAVGAVVLLGVALICLAIYFQTNFDQWYLLQSSLVRGWC